MHRQANVYGGMSFLFEFLVILLTFRACASETQIYQLKV